MTLLSLSDSSIQPRTGHKRSSAVFKTKESLSSFERTLIWFKFSSWYPARWLRRGGTRCESMIRSKIPTRCLGYDETLTLEPSPIFSMGFSCLRQLSCREDTRKENALEFMKNVSIFCLFSAIAPDFSGSLQKTKRTRTVL